MEQVDSFAERPVRSALSGCLYATFVVSVSVGLLLANALLCVTIYGAIPKSGSEALTSRLGQLFFFVAPVLLLLVQWNLLDRLQRLFSRRG